MPDFTTELKNIHTTIIRRSFDTARELLLIARGLSFSCCDSYTKDLMKDIPIVRVGFVHKNVQEVLSQLADFEIKLDIFNQISENTKKKKLLRIFVGSSVGNLDPLLEAELGLSSILASLSVFATSELLALLPKPKSAVKLPSAENEAKTTEDENVEAEKQQAEKPKSAMYWDGPPLASA
ncbi:hypothetical protein ACE6H2_001749 [Prunus campanulata]